MVRTKGITLIALIITIMVMLILAGVSVNIAFGSGLFKATQGATKKIEAERVNEIQLSTEMQTVINSTTHGPEQIDINSFMGSGNKKYISTEGDPYIGCYAYVDGVIRNNICRLSP